MQPAALNSCFPRARFALLVASNFPPSIAVSPAEITLSATGSTSLTASGFSGATNAIGGAELVSPVRVHVPATVAPTFRNGDDPDAAGSFTNNAALIVV